MSKTVFRQAITVVSMSSLLFATPVLAKDNSTPVFTLTDVIALAIRNNTSLQQDKLNRINQKFAVLLQKWNFQPQYSLNASYDYNHTVAGGAGTFQRNFSIKPEAKLNSHHGTTFTLSSDNTFASSRYDPSLTLEVKQQLSKGVSEAVVDAALNTAEDNEFVNKLKFKDDVTSAVGTVINNYVQLINDQLSLESDKANLAALVKTVDNTKLQIKAGQQANSNLIDAQSQVASARLAIEQGNNAIFSAREALLDSVGLKSTVQFRLPKDLNAELRNDEKILSGGKEVPDVKTSEDSALKNNSSYQTAAITVKIAARNLMVTKDNNRWNFSLDAKRTQGGSGASELFDGKNYSDDVGLNLSVPINDLKNKADLVSAQISLDNAISSLSQAKRQLFSNVRDQLNSVISTKEQLDIAKKAVILQQKNVDMTEKLHQFGRASTFELLQKQQDLVTDRNAVIASETSYLDALAGFDTQLNILLQRWNIKIRY